MSIRDRAHFVRRARGAADLTELSDIERAWDDLCRNGYCGDYASGSFLSVRAAIDARLEELVAEET
jgi:hypothetical protein